MKAHQLAKTFTAGLAMLSLLTLGFLAPAPASANADYNDYNITGLPHYLTAPATFTVTVDGPDAICSMEYKDVPTTTQPWTFTVTPADLQNYVGTEVKVFYCNTEYGHDYVRLETMIPFSFKTTVLPVEKGKKTTSREYLFYNKSDQPATLTINNTKGVPVYTTTVAGLNPDAYDGITSVMTKIPTKGITTTQRYTAVATLPDGTTMTSPVWMAVGWGVLLSDRPATWEPCATITWSYSTKNQPKGANTLKKDIKASLARLSKLTGVTFTEVPFGYHDAATGDPALLRYGWIDLGKNGPSGIGGTGGDVNFNYKDFWPLNKNAGFNRLHGYLPGRGWLIIHETMHVMGFDHVDDRTQVMNPIGYTVKFGTGDLAGLHAIYPKNCKA